MNRLALLLIIGLVDLKQIAMFNVDFYEKPNFEGRRAGGKLYCRCQSLPEWFWDTASSVDTHSNCVIVYTREDCTSKGRPVTFHSDGTTEPDDIPHKNFTGTWLNDNVRSYRACNCASRLTL